MNDLLFNLYQIKKPYSRENWIYMKTRIRAGEYEGGGGVITNFYTPRSSK